MRLNPFKTWQRLTLAYLFLCASSGALIAAYAESISKPLILWQFILAWPVWLIIKAFAIILGGFWLPLAVGTTFLVGATVAPSVR